jgi:peptidoglycan L-alanyl-D-glutamate endopeptidase CwlK
MSAPFFKDDIEFLQRFLKSGGFYRDELDGEWGPNTEEAMTAFDAASTAIRQEMGELDSRSEQKIRTLHLPVQRAARRALQSLAAAGITAKIISGTRTYAEQDALFEIGRSKPGDRVTNARGGESNHNFGLAWDIGIWVDGFYDGKRTPPDKALEKRADDQYQSASSAILGLSIAGLEWGGNWASLKDFPHYQLAGGLTVSRVRERFERGEPYLPTG